VKLCEEAKERDKTATAKEFQLTSQARKARKSNSRNEGESEENSEGNSETFSSTALSWLEEACEKVGSEHLSGKAKSDGDQRLQKLHKPCQLRQPSEEPQPSGPEDPTYLSVETG